RGETGVAFRRLALARAGDELAVTRQLHHAVVALDAVMVPLAERLRPPFARQAAHPTRGVRPIRLARRPLDAEQVAVARVVGALGPVENLHLYRSRKTVPHNWQTPA